MDIDGPAIIYDPGAKNFYGVAVEIGRVSNHAAYGYIGCPSGAPGSAACPNDWHSSFEAFDRGHPVVGINPCTHHPIFTTNTTSNTIRMQIRDTKNAVVKISDVANIEYKDNSNCNGESCDNYNGEICKCTGPSSTDCGTAQCAESIAKVHIATKYDSSTGRCYAYLGYDRSCNASNGHSYRKANMAIVEIRLS